MLSHDAIAIILLILALYAVGYLVIWLLGFGFPRPLTWKERLLSAFLQYPEDIDRRAIQRHWIAMFVVVAVTYVVVTTVFF